MSSNLNGYNIIVTPDVPKMKLSADCPVTPTFRAEIDAWMFEFFGAANLIEDGQMIADGQNIYVNPRTFSMLKVI